MDEQPRREERAVYIISVAAELAGVHPQTLRVYERKGLLRPERTVGNTRRYSPRDLERLRQIQELTQEGVNLAGVKKIIELERELETLRTRTQELEREVLRHRRAVRRHVEGPGSQLVPLRSVLMLPWERTDDHVAREPATAKGMGDPWT
jgi:MerR family transcriptional regulator/heat shock protein HspR